MKVLDKNISAICQDINIYFGHGSIKLLESISDSNVLFVTDRGIVDCGLLNNVMSYLPQNNKVDVFDAVKPDPSFDIVAQIIVRMKNFKPNVVIAVGGGSPIDSAKGAIHILQDDVSYVLPCFIAVPTTSGTGSEVTDFTVLTDLDTKKKHVIIDKGVLPDIAVLDSDLLANLPKSIIAFTGVDSMAHAIESYVAKGANDYSEGMAEKAGELIFHNLVASYEGDKEYAREKMHHASTLAALSFNSAGLGIVHSLAHQIGAKFHLPHGLCISLVLTEVMKLNARDERVLSKYAKYAKKAGVATSFDGEKGSFIALINAIDDIRKKLSLPMRIRDCKIDFEYDFEKLKHVMARDAMFDMCTPQNPRVASIDELVKIYETIF